MWRGELFDHSHMNLVESVVQGIPVENHIEEPAVEIPVMVC